MKISVIGGGLAGCEAAWQAAQHGIDVELYEMRPETTTGAHRTGDLGELVCSNSLGSNMPNRASGLLKAELRKMGSLLIACADASSLPAGGALAVDRIKFSALIQEKIFAHPKISVIRKEITQIPESPAVLATGPLTSHCFLEALMRFTGEEHLYFFDAIAPIVELDSIDMAIAFRANRYGQAEQREGDYINCPMDIERYFSFREALIQAKRIPLKDFESEIDQGVVAGKSRFFQGCQPIEVIANAGEKALAFGPMRPVGLTDPKTGRWPFAVVQLRQDNLAGDLYNMVGFQTNLTFAEQKRVFRMIPGLENASFSRLGQMHRNAFIDSPKLLDRGLSFKAQPGLFIAGQLAGIEGYAGNIASGLLAGINAVRHLNGLPYLEMPQTTMIGALMHYITHAEITEFQPTKAMFGLLPKPSDEKRRNKSERFEYYSQRALHDLTEFLRNSK